MRFHAQPKPLRGPLAGGSDGATVAVEPLHGGEVTLPRASFEAPGGSFEGLKVMGVLGSRRRAWASVHCPCFLITHPSAGPVLVDTGLHPSVAAKPAANLGRLLTAYARPRLEPGRDIPSQLRERGIDPKSVGVVIMTHLHFDHASGIAEFPNSAIVLTAAEWRAATTGRRPLLRGYRPAHYDYAFDYRTVDYAGEGIASYASFGHTFDLFGDGSVRLASTPGHTLGHQSVICRLREHDLVIAGDAVYTIRQLDGGPPQPRPHDPHLWRRSLRELQLFRSRYPQAVIVPGHDPGHWATLKRRYE